MGNNRVIYGNQLTLPGLSTLNGQIQVTPHASLSSSERELAKATYELFDWWLPQRLFDETSGINLERIKYLIKQRKLQLSTGTPEELPLRKEEVVELAKLLPKPIDGKEFTFIDLFAGIGGIRKPFSDIGGRCALTCEWDEYAVKTYKANWANSPGHKFISNIKDVTQPANKKGKELRTNIENEIPSHDVLLAGFPCQPFSIAGVSKKNALNRVHGFECEDQGQLFFDIARILSVKQPPVAVLENVKNLKSHNKGTTFQVIQDTLINLDKHQESLFDSNSSTVKPYWIVDLGASNPDPKVIDAQHFVPQHRERIVLVCIRKDIVEKLNLEKRITLRDIDKPKKRSTLRDVLDPHSKVDSKYELSPKLWDYLQNYARKHRAAGNGFGFGMVSRESKGVARTLSARYYKDGSEILVNQNHPDKRPRRLTPQECARLMGFVTKNEKFNIPVSDTRAYKQFGNSVVVPVFESVARLVAPYIDEILSSQNSNTTELPPP
jgi:DNA (cytosine-5)-methyltransferase 1